MLQIVSFYIDGACSGNPGPGGWGIVRNNNQDKKKQEYFGGELDTTNNRMELIAAIKALEIIEPSLDIEINIYTDSTYVRNGITIWVHKWQINNWQTSGKQAVKNKDLWQQLIDLSTKRNVNWYWVKGHSGNPYNERADFLARHAIVQQTIQSSINQ